ncbi:MAG: nucleoside deaminase [Acidimicrobiia bacterium]|nr:nucleoside deaminase [Acidimicrobiia bacterium]
MTHSPEQLHAWMELALSEARRALDHDDVPIGAVLVDPAGSVITSDHNRREQRKDVLAHAEMLVLSAASGGDDWRLTDHTLVVTLEPCAMCAGAIQQARLSHLVYGAADLKAGACWSLYNIPQDARLNHRVEMTAGVLAEQSSRLLSEFFAERR